MDYTDQRFQEGQEVKGIYWPGETSVTVGNNNVEKITVVMEYGQMAAVPWFAVWKEGTVVSKWNGAMLEGVELCLCEKDRIPLFLLKAFGNRFGGG